MSVEGWCDVKWDRQGRPCEKVPYDQVQGLWCVKAGEVVTKQTRGRESVGDRAAEPRAGKGVRSCSVLELKCEWPLT